MISEVERLEMLNALKKSQRRYVGVLELCAALVERQANLGDPLAGFVVDQLHEATTAMKSENVAGLLFARRDLSLPPAPCRQQGRGAVSLISRLCLPPQQRGLMRGRHPPHWETQQRVSLA